MYKARRNTSGAGASRVVDTNTGVNVARASAVALLDLAAADAHFISAYAQACSNHVLPLRFRSWDSGNPVASSKASAARAACMRAALEVPPEP